MDNLSNFSYAIASYLFAQLVANKLKLRNFLDVTGRPSNVDQNGAINKRVLTETNPISQNIIPQKNIKPALQCENEKLIPSADTTQNLLHKATNIEQQEVPETLNERKDLIINISSEKDNKNSNTSFYSPSNKTCCEGNDNSSIHQDLNDFQNQNSDTKFPNYDNHLTTEYNEINTGHQMQKVDTKLPQVLPFHVTQNDSLPSQKDFHTYESNISNYVPQVFSQNSFESNLNNYSLFPNMNNTSTVNGKSSNATEEISNNISLAKTTSVGSLKIVNVEIADDELATSNQTRNSSEYDCFQVINNIPDYLSRTQSFVTQPEEITEKLFDNNSNEIKPVYDNISVDFEMSQKYDEYHASITCNQSPSSSDCKEMHNPNSSTVSLKEFTTISAKTSTLLLTKPLKSTKKSSPIIAKKSAPVRVKKYTPMLAKKSTPVRIKKSTLILAKKSTPVRVKKSTPVRAKKSTPVRVKKSTPVCVKKSTPVRLKKTTPVRGKKSTPTTTKTFTKKVTPVPAKKLKKSTSTSVKKSTPIFSKKSNSTSAKRSTKEFTPIFAKESTLTSGKKFTKESTPLFTKESSLKFAKTPIPMLSKKSSLISAKESILTSTPMFAKKSLISAKKSTLTSAKTPAPILAKKSSLISAKESTSKSIKLTSSYKNLPLFKNSLPSSLKLVPENNKSVTENNLSRRQDITVKPLISGIISSIKSQKIKSYSILQKQAPVDTNNSLGLSRKRIAPAEMTQVEDIPSKQRILSINIPDENMQLMDYDTSDPPTPSISSRYQTCRRIISSLNSQTISRLHFSLADFKRSRRPLNTSLGN